MTSTAKKSLLIVDDDAALRGVMAATFHQLGYRVRSAEDGFAALRLMRCELPDVLLSDLNMPGMSGFELLSVVRRRLPAIRVVAMSGAFSGDGVQAGVAADAFYEKAGKLPTLLQLVQSEQAVTRPLNFQQETSTAPIWISATAEAFEYPRSIIITCPECFRTFPHLVAKSEEVICVTACHYCKISINFAVVPSLDQASPSPIQRNRRSPAKLL